MVAVPVHCQLCDAAPPVTLIMRECRHAVCLPCLIGHLRFYIVVQQKARIKCPRPACHARIHENDVAAVLDPQEKILDSIMPVEGRLYLQYKYNKHMVVHALGGAERVVRCPLCKSVYTENPGCHYVQCANRQCALRFCWECGHPVKSFAHFAGGICRVGIDDLHRGSFVFRFLLTTDGITLAMLFPWVIGLAFMAMPLGMIVLLPLFVCQHIHRSATSHSDFLLPEEWCMMISKMVVSVVILFPVSLVLAIACVGTSVSFVFAYSFLLCLKLVPPFDRIMDIIDWFMGCLECMGLEGWKQMLKDARDKKEAKEREEYQREEEASERLGAGAGGGASLSIRAPSLVAGAVAALPSSILAARFLDVQWHPEAHAECGGERGVERRLRREEESEVVDETE